MNPSPAFIHPDSLGDTLDAVNAAFFYQQPIPAADRRETALWIADRHGLPGSYAGMFAPTEYDYAFGALTFTGDPVRSGAATGHVLSEEACSALFRLGQADARVRQAPEVQKALEQSRRGILHRLEESEVQGQWSGVYCCGTCSVALWRHLLASGAADDAHRLENGLSELKRYRDGRSRWRRFPFYYTLLALIEIDLPAVREEIQYAAPVIERALRRLEKAQLAAADTPADEHDRRKRIVMERVMEKC